MTYDMYGMNQFFKIAGTPHLALQHVEDVFPDMCRLIVLEINSTN